MAHIYCDWRIISCTAKLILAVTAVDIWFGCFGLPALRVGSTV